MKLVALLPVKNEAWILPAYLSSVAPLVDEIIAIDDGSDDETAELIACAGGRVIAAREGGDWETHWGWIREDMLRAGRERGGTHFLCLDADEALTAPARAHLRPALEALEPGEKLAMRWLALWKSARRYRDDASVWSNSVKDFAFADRPGYTFTGQWPHRVGRTPGPNDSALWRTLPLEQGAVLHYQFTPWERFQYKQAWYRCAELLRAPGRAPEINQMYSHSLGDDSARTLEVPADWLEGIDVPPGLQSLAPTWHRDQVLLWFDEHGAAFFEPLQIWHVPELLAAFRERMGRDPKDDLRVPLRRRIRRRLGLMAP